MDDHDKLSVFQTHSTLICPAPHPFVASQISQTEEDSIGLIKLCHQENDDHIRSEYCFKTHCTPIQNSLEPGRLLLKGPLDLKQPGYFDHNLLMWRRLYTTINGIDINVLEDTPDETSFDSCHGEMIIWSSSLILARNIEISPWIRNIINKGNIIELGAGSGLPSLVSLSCGATCIQATEGNNHSIEFLKKNVNFNKSLTSFGKAHSLNRINCINNNNNMDSLLVSKLFWGNENDILSLQNNFKKTDSYQTKHNNNNNNNNNNTNNPTIDLIMGSDITYDKDLHVVLISTLNSLMSDSTICLLAHDIQSTPLARKAYHLFKELIKKYDFVCCEILPFWRLIQTNKTSIVAQQSGQQSEVYEDLNVKILYIRKPSYIIKQCMRELTTNV